jgi:hypothetical protein
MLSSSPAENGSAITPSNSTDLAPFAYRALWVGTAGNIAVIFSNDRTNSGAGTAVTITNVQGGTLLPFSVKKVMSTNTTASNIVGVS